MRVGCLKPACVQTLCWLICVCLYVHIRVLLPANPPAAGHPHPPARPSNAPLALLPCRPPNPDPAAQAFVARFLMLSRAAHLAYLANADPTLAAALDPLTEAQWGVLKGYLFSMLPTFAEDTYNMFMAAGGQQIIAGIVQVGLGRGGGGGGGTGGLGFESGSQ